MKDDIFIVLDKSLSVPIFPEQCIFCVHYRGCTVLTKDFMPVHTCDAFPKGIPHDIIFDKFKHTQPYEGDNGILFERVEAK